MRGIRRALVAAVVVAASAGAWPDAVGTSLRTPPEHGQLKPSTLGETFSDGLEILQVVDGPLTLRDVRTIGPAGVTALGFMVVSPTDAAGDVISTMPGYPPAVSGLREGKGAVLGESGDRESWNLLIGYRVDADARWERTGLVVVYEKGGRTFTQHFPATLIVCQPSEPDDECWDDRLGER